MLSQLKIQNYALIETLEMTPSPSLNIITGETGAGKSIMLGAVGLLLGNRADTKVLFNTDQKCVIEGAFDISDYQLNSLFENEDLDYDAQTIIRREISPSGKSRAFVNDTPVTLDILKKLGVRLMDIHSQHDNLNIGDQKYQLEVLDIFANHPDLLSDYTGHYSTYKEANRAYTDLKSTADQLRQEADFFQFQYDELSKASLVDGEQEALENELQELENAEDIKLKLNQLVSALGDEEMGATSLLSNATSLIQQLSRFGDHYSSLNERLHSVLVETQDILDETNRIEEKVIHDPARIEEVKERISLIFSLQQKHRVQTISELLAIQAELEVKVEKSSSIDTELDKALAHLNKNKTKAEDAADHLSKSRKSVQKNLGLQITELLRKLGMPEATFEVTIADQEMDSSGRDAVQFVFSANKGVAPQDIRQVASGGEFSRLMFCLKYILADKTALPTIIFDEIDTGVSGEIAKKMVAMMKEMAQAHQVIAISHLPQFAAKGDQHYFVYKDNSSDRTISKIKVLDEDQRVFEIAKMIDGDNPSTSAVQSARDLITQ
ncbi:MAG: DNA repair protein RecN [Cyclobacteriaceae bacterium]